MAASRVTVNTLYSLSVFKLRQQQFFVVRIDDAYKPGSTLLAFETVAFKSAAIDLGTLASTERKQRVALRTCDDLSPRERSRFVTSHGLSPSAQFAKANDRLPI